MFVHDTEPAKLPGVTVMKARRAEMTFRYEDIGAGGKISLTPPIRRTLPPATRFMTFCASRFASTRRATP